MKKYYNKNYKHQYKSKSFITTILVILMTLGVASLMINILNINTSWANDLFKTNQNDNEDNENEELVETLEKQLYCQYDSTINFESAVGGLRIYVPTYEGYINYNFIHSIKESTYTDVWRIGQAYAFDDNLENEFELTLKGAEWDMALKIDGRDDFIGGYAHGDEIFTSLSFFIDGVSNDITSIKELTSFEEITIFETSIGYDPNDHTTKALNHYKEYIINKNGITLNQRVEWLNDYTIGSSYMAMMPPLKTLTDSFYTDKNYTPTLITEYGTYIGCTKAVVYGSTSNINYMMSVPKYPSLTGGDRFLLTDNGGGAYNKMYFVICNGYDVTSGEVWETTTQYKIING